MKNNLSFITYYIIKITSEQPFLGFFSSFIKKGGESNAKLHFIFTPLFCVGKKTRILLVQRQKNDLSSEKHIFYRGDLYLKKFNVALYPTWIQYSLDHRGQAIYSILH